MTFVGSRDKTNDFFHIFTPYTARPGRDEEWYNKRKSELTPEDLGGLTPELYMEQAYPRSIEEALRVGGTASAFDSDVISEMMLETKNPVKLPDKDIDYNIINIYKPFSLGHYYISAADIAHGVGKDYSVAGIMDVKTGEVCADIMRNDLPAESFAEHYLKMLELYRKPKAAPEDNDIGHTVIMKMQQANYKHFIYQDDKKTKAGWHTGDNNRRKALENLIPAVNNRQIIVYNQKGVEQLSQLIRNVEKAGRIEASSGGNDDYAMMLAICWANKDKVDIVEWKDTTIHTLH
uniref:Putative terminase n=1 Tax=viral metagenome TaxID=1070528 RepID=A0A6M3KYV0_9ZZZZ